MLQALPMPEIAPATLPAPERPENPPAAERLDNIDALHAAHSPRIFRFLMASVRDRDIAMTLTQDTFVNAWRYRESFRGDCALETWLMRIAVNALRSHTRRGAYRFWKKADLEAVDAHETEIPHQRSSAEDDLIAREQLKLVWNKLKVLSSRQRTIFLLRYVEQLELPDIAVATGLPLSTVKSHLYRALDKVRATQKSFNPGRIHAK